METARLSEIAAIAEEGSYFSRRIEGPVAPDVVIAKKTFVHCDFRGVTVSGVTFKDCHFEKCDFEHSQWTGVTFDDCKFREGEILKIHLRECDFKACRFTSISLNQGSLHEIRFHSCCFSICDLKTNLSCVKFWGTEQEPIVFQQCTIGDWLRNVSFTFSHLTACCIHSRISEMESSEPTLLFIDCTMRSTIFSHQHYENAWFTNCNLTDAAFEHASNLSQSRFINCDLTRLAFNQAVLDNSIIYPTAYAGLDLSQCRSVKGLRIPRYVFEDIQGKDFDPAKKRTLDLEDDYGKLRLIFGGYWRWVAVASFVFATFPYARFILENVVVWALFGQYSAESETLLYGLFKYALFGKNADWTFGSIAVLIFNIAFLLYLMLRAWLWIQTLKHETEHTVKGIYPDFKLASPLPPPISPWKHALPDTKKGCFVRISAMLNRKAFHYYRRIIKYWATILGQRIQTFYVDWNERFAFALLLLSLTRFGVFLYEERIVTKWKSTYEFPLQFKPDPVSEGKE